MNGYFKLQYTMLLRKMADLSTNDNPLINLLHLLFFLFLFFILSSLLFKWIEHAVYIYIIISLFLSSSLNKVNRNDFLKMSFGKRNSIKIRMIENMMISIPFIIFLCFKMELIPIIILLIFSMIIATTNRKTSYNIVIPTPFYSRPFEFTIGFRNSYYLIIFAYLLAFIGIKVNNFGLCIFSIITIFLIMMSYFLHRENEYFVWTYNLQPLKFLLFKIKTTVINATFLLLPIIIFITAFFFTKIIVLSLLVFLGYFYLIMVLLSKYTLYPNDLDMKNTFIIIFSFYVPLMLIVVIPLFFRQALVNLRSHLV